MVFSGFFDEPKQQRARPRFNDADKKVYYDGQNGKCAGCGEKMPMKVMQVDHKKAFSKGGNDKPGNLQLLCGPCNGSKNNKTQANFEKRLAKGEVKGAAKVKPSVTGKKGTTASKATAKSTTKKSSAKKTTRKPKDPFADLFSF